MERVGKVCEACECEVWGGEVGGFHDSLLTGAKEGKRFDYFQSKPEDLAATLPSSFRNHRVSFSLFIHQGREVECLVTFVNLHDGWLFKKKAVKKNTKRESSGETWRWSPNWICCLDGPERRSSAIFSAPLGPALQAGMGAKKSFKGNGRFQCDHTGKQLFMCSDKTW